MPLNQSDARKLIERRHPEWAEHAKRWRWLLDSYEGGERYRHADYSGSPFAPPRQAWYLGGMPDPTTNEVAALRFGQVVERNLVPHISETTNQGTAMYAMRLHRTPVPKLLDLVVRRYLSRIYSEPIARKGPPELETWWEDVDGEKTPVMEWMRHTVAPLLLVYGQLDLVFGHPVMTEDDLANMATRADAVRLGAHQVVASYILPENVVWWRKSASGRYLEVLVHERCDDHDGDDDDGPYWRHWTEFESTLYDGRGDVVLEESYEHPFGRVPIVRVFDERKLRCRNVGQPRFEEVAELQKSIYNRSSELIQGDVVHSHAVLQGPEDYCAPDSKLHVGPGGLLPMRRSADGNSYQGFEFIDPPQSGAVECRVHIQDDLDSVLRAAYMLKPAGMVSNGTTAQSGISKIADQSEGAAVLAEAAQSLRNAERVAAEFALVVARDGPIEPSLLDQVEVDYPVEFNLFSVQELADALVELQGIASAMGELPETEAEGLTRLITQIFVGLPKIRLDELKDEITALAATKAKTRAELAEARPMLAPPTNSTPPASNVDAEELDPVTNGVMSNGR